jgi:hypothetical protein
MHIRQRYRAQTLGFVTGKIGHFISEYSKKVTHFNCILAILEGEVCARLCCEGSRRNALVVVERTGGLKE